MENNALAFAFIGGVLVCAILFFCIEEVQNNSKCEIAGGKYVHSECFKKDLFINI